MQTFKEYAVSSFVTFFGSFLMVVSTTWDTGFTAEAVKSGLIWGAIFTAVRAGLKAVIEDYLLQMKR